MSVNISTADNWIIESQSIDMTGKYREVYRFNSLFRSTPRVTATAFSPSGYPIGNANIHIVSVTKKEVDISVSASIPGMRIQLHIIGK